MVVVVVGSSARFYPDLAVKPIIDSVSAPKPIAAFLVPEAPDALARLAAAGVPSFHTPEACADAVAAALQRHRAEADRGADSNTPTGGGKMLDELQAYTLLRSCRRSACAVDRTRRRCDASARPALCLSRRGQGAVRRHRAQVRCRRRGAERSR